MERALVAARSAKQQAEANAANKPTKSLGDILAEQPQK
jgi:hypothetical protein